MTMRPVNALILAAGTASRMGELKQLLPLRGVPVLEHVIQQVLEEDFTKVVAVIGHEAGRIQEKITVTDRRFRWAVNPHYQTGQASSLKFGFEMLAGEGELVMVFLGDLPFLTSETIRGIYEEGQVLAASRNTPFVIRPSCNGTKGHPVFFARIGKEHLSHLLGDTGGRSIMKHMDQYDLPMEDEGILLDIDHPQDYEAAKERMLRILGK